SYNKAKEKEAELANLDSNITKLQAEIDTLIPWQDLDVAFSEIKDLKNTSYFLGTIAKSYEDTLLEELSNAYVEIRSRSSNDINLLILSNKEDSENVSEVLRGVGFSAFKTEHKDVPMKLILEFKHQIEELQSKKFFIEEEIASFEEDLKKLELAYDYFVSKVERVKVSTNFLKTKNICAIQGWIAQEDNEELKSICSNTLKNDYYIEFEDVKEDEIDDVINHNLNYALEYSYDDLAFELMHILFNFYVERNKVENIQIIISQYYDLYQKNNTRENTITYYIDMATFFYSIKEYNEAVNYYSRARDLIKNSEKFDKEKYSYICYKEGKSYEKLGLLEETYSSIK
ncbi:MAG: hypothetical protein E6427_07280, partial [Anaerococcus sp.]|nr:hypothetical protein [Anaerococcus sp.]